MICKELKNFSDNVFGFKKRFSVGSKMLNSIDKEDMIPLADNMYYDHLTSSLDTLTVTAESHSVDLPTESPSSFKSVTNETSNITSPPATQKCSQDQKIGQKIIIKNLLKSAARNGTKLGHDKMKCKSPVTKTTNFSNCDWSFTWYDFDGRGRITKKDMATVMRSVYEIIRQHNSNASKSSPAKLTSQSQLHNYRLHLILQVPPSSDQQSITGPSNDLNGLDLASSDEQIYKLTAQHHKSTSTLLTCIYGNGDGGGFDADSASDTDSTLRIQNTSVAKEKSLPRRSKSTPIQRKVSGNLVSSFLPLLHSSRNTRRRRSHISSKSTSLVSLAGSCNTLHALSTSSSSSSSSYSAAHSISHSLYRHRSHHHRHNHHNQKHHHHHHHHRHHHNHNHRKHRQHRSKRNHIKQVNQKVAKSNTKKTSKLNARPISNSCQNVVNSDFLDFTDLQTHVIPTNPATNQFHSKHRTKQHIKKYLGRKQVEEWLCQEHLVDGIESAEKALEPSHQQSLYKPVKILHHHHHHHLKRAGHTSDPTTTTTTTAATTNINNNDNEAVTSAQSNKDNSIHHHFHFHHHHHHYFH